MKINFGTEPYSLKQFLDKFPFEQRNNQELLPSFINFIDWLSKKHLAGYVFHFEQVKLDLKQRILATDDGLIRPIVNFNELKKALANPIEFADFDDEKSLLSEFKNLVFAKSKLTVRPNFLAPEASVNHHDYRSDIFSIGVFLAAFFSNCTIYNQDEYFYLLKNGVENFKWTDARIMILAKKCLHLNLLERPSSNLILEQLNKIYLDNNLENSDFHSSYHSIIQGFKASLLHFSSKNQLFHFNETNSVICIDTTFQDFIKNGYSWKFPLNSQDKVLTTLHQLKRKQNAEIREKGEDNLFVISCFISWNENEEQRNTPLFLHEVDFKVVKDFQWNFTIDCISDEIVINEVLKVYFSENYQIQLPSSIPNNKEAIDRFQEYFLTVLSEKGAQNFSIENALYLGLFSYHNFSIASDYEQLLQQEPNNIIKSLLGFEKEQFQALETPFNRFEKHWVLQADPSQEMALHIAETNSIVIEGPPGTGKSQTIANLIAQALGKEQKVLFVSEKRAALDVVYKKLEQAELGYLSLLVHDAKKEKKHIIESIAAGMQRLSEPLMRQADLGKKLASWKLEEEYEKLHKYYQTVRNNDFGFTLNELFLQWEKQEVEIPENFIPDLGDFLSANHELQELYQFLEKEGYQIWCQSPLSCLNARFFAIENESVNAYFKALSRAEHNIVFIKEIYNKIGIDHLTIGDLLQIRSFAKSLKWLLERNFLKLVLEENTLKNQYEKLRDQFLAKQVLLEKRNKKSLLSAGNELTLRELESALALCQHSVKTEELEEFMSRNFELETAWFAKDYENIIKNAIYEYKNEEQLIELRSKFQSQFKTQNPIDFIEQVSLLQDISQRTAFQLHEFFDLLNTKRFPDAILLAFLKFEDELNILETEAYKLHINFRNLTCLDFEEYLTKLRDFSFSEKHVLALKTFNSLKENLKYCLNNGAYTFKQFKIASINREIQRAFLANPQLEKYDSKRLIALNDQLQISYEEWLKWNACNILDIHVKKLAHKQNLAETPAQKLRANEKVEKWSFKRGFRLLHHEIDKERRHKSLRELLQSDAKHVIEILKPVFLLSPKAVSEIVPCEKDSFDLVIFDEASQIKLEEVLPICQRAKRVVVVGDSQQLPPNNFFKIIRNSANTFDDLAFDSFLLAAKAAFKTTSLSWHYRSKNAALINFSNAAFYNFQLQVFPAFNLEKTSIEIIKVEKAVYNNRQNTVEASALVNNLAECIKIENGLSYAVITMSEAQQEAVEKAIAQLRQTDFAFDEALQNAENRFENGAFSGLLIKNLESMQGEERDVVFISIGYGFDEQGKFRQHFGPIMQDGGDRRLNVLLSRAKMKMKIFCSFDEKEITNDQNLGAWTLKMFMQYAKAIELGNEQIANQILVKMNGAATIQPNESTNNKVVSKYRKILEEQLTDKQKLLPLRIAEQTENYVYQIVENNKVTNLIYELEPNEIDTWKEFFVSKMVLAKRGFQVQKVSLQELARSSKKLE